jgi:hypothetical protein
MEPSDARPAWEAADLQQALSCGAGACDDAILPKTLRRACQHVPLRVVQTCFLHGRVEIEKRI